MNETDGVVGIQPAGSTEPARWILQSGVDWQLLVRYGPPGFDAYVRVAFSQAARRDPVDRPEEVHLDSVRAALVLLASHTTTPANGYAAIWEGWSGASDPRAPRLEIPNRPMLLFTGPIEALRDVPALAWYGSATGIAQEPHLVWPADHAWCLACEVDEEIEFTVGSSDSASQALMSALPGGVRTVDYGEPAPLFRDEQ